MLALIETLPGPLPASRLDTPPWVGALAALPGTGPVLDLVSDQYHALLYQTVHQRPLAFGYVSRVPERIERLDAPIAALAERRDCAALGREYGFQYVVTAADTPCQGGVVRYGHGRVVIVDVGGAAPYIPHCGGGLAAREDGGGGR